MKKFMFLATAGLLALASCQEKAGYTIKGTAEGVADGETVFLQDYVDGNFVKKDSAVVKAGAFEFKGTPDSVTVSRYVTCWSNNQRMMTMVFLENGVINVNLAPKGESIVAGTLCNDAYQKFMGEYGALSKEMREMYRKSMADSTLTDAQREEIMKELDKKDSLGMEMVLNAMASNIDNAMGVHMLASYGSSFPAEKVEPLLDKVPAAFSNNEKVVELKNYFSVLKKTAVGQKFTDFSMNTPEGQTVKLSDFISQNKYTLIDFWASWCGPCRREMPVVVEAYKNFKAKGFGIVGVSLDEDLDKWKKAITDLNITWPQMSDLKGWQCEGAKLYGVRGIPATVLVDQEGTIVARDLRGDDLGKKLGELMK